MADLADGYSVAEADLDDRGAGELWGTRQAGDASRGFLRYARYVGMLVSVHGCGECDNLVVVLYPGCLVGVCLTCMYIRVPGADNDLCEHAVVVAQQLLRRYGLDPDAWPRALLAAMKDMQPVSADVSAPSVSTDAQEDEVVITAGRKGRPVSPPPQQ